MTPKLVKGMTDSDLLDMHYFLTEDDDWDGDEPKEGFCIDLFLITVFFSCPLLAGFFCSRFLRKEEFPII